MVEAYNLARRPVDGTFAKKEWLALSEQLPLFEYDDSEGDVQDPLSPIDCSAGCARALLNFAEQFRTEVFYVTLTLVKRVSASSSGAHALGIFVSSQSVEVRDTHCRSADGRGVTSMSMPRTALLQEDRTSVAEWLFHDHYERAGIKPPCDTFCVSVDWEGSVGAMMLAHDPWHKILTIKPLPSRLRHGDD